jgi:hypothetical protein
LDWRHPSQSSSPLSISRARSVLFAPGRRLSCVEALTRKRDGTSLEVSNMAVAEDGVFGQYCASMIPSQAARAAGWLTYCSSSMYQCPKASLQVHSVAKISGGSSTTTIMILLERKAKKREQGVGTPMVVHEGASRSSEWYSIACASPYRYQIIGRSRVFHGTGVCRLDHVTRTRRRETGCVP